MINTKYYADHYGNQYRWTTKKQNDGKFHVTFVQDKKFKTHHSTWNEEVIVKHRSFRKKKTAIAYCLNASRKAKERQAPIIERRNKKYQERQVLRRKNQDIALKKREEKKQERLALQPKGKEKSKIEAKKNVEHYKKLIKKTDTKIKSLNTRKKNYKKKLKYYEKRVASMRDIYISKNRNIPKYSEIED